MGAIRFIATPFGPPPRSWPHWRVDRCDDGSDGRLTDSWGELLGSFAALRGVRHLFLPRIAHSGLLTTLGSSGRSLRVSPGSIFLCFSRCSGTLSNAAETSANSSTSAAAVLLLVICLPPRTVWLIINVVAVWFWRQPVWLIAGHASRRTAWPRDPGAPKLQALAQSCRRPAPWRRRWAASVVELRSEGFG